MLVVYETNLDRGVINIVSIFNLTKSMPCCISNHMVHPPKVQQLRWELLKGPRLLLWRWQCKRCVWNLQQQMRRRSRPVVLRHSVAVMLKGSTCLSKLQSLDGVCNELLLFPLFQYYIEGPNVIQRFKVGACIATKEDCAKYPWRKRLVQEVVARPPNDGVLHTEAWRIPKKRNRNVAQPQYKTVCRVMAITLDGIENRRLGTRQRVKPSDVHLTVRLYVRPSDIGQRPKCPYEVIETNQGDCPFKITCFIDQFCHCSCPSHRAWRWTARRGEVWTIVRRCSTLGWQGPQQGSAPLSLLWKV